MTVDIFIKSFNRAYYLERCISSIKQYVTGNYVIKVLDDGTPPAYLQKIAAQHPEVQFYFSASYQQKVASIERYIANNEPLPRFSIPVDLWTEQIAKGSKIFLLLEDDIWLTGPLDLEKICGNFEKHNVAMLKLSWLGNPKLVAGSKKRLTRDMEEVRPPINFFTTHLVKNTGKVRSVLDRLRLLNLTSYYSVYSLYTVASAFFDKGYWLFLWQNAEEKVNESRQLMNAIHWQRANPGMKFCKTERELAKTSFITSATNNFAEVPLDIVRLNYHLNELWYKGRLNSQQNIPDDFDLDYIVSFLNELNDPKCEAKSWLQWVEKFRGIYRKVGCKVD